MVTDLIVSALLGALTALTSLIPSFTIPGLSLTAYNGFGGYAHAFDRVFPLSYCITLALFTLTLKLTFVMFDLGVWVFHQLHGSD